MKKTLVHVPFDQAVDGETYLTDMKHGWIEGFWDKETESCSKYYWRNMEWYPNSFSKYYWRNMEWYPNSFSKYYWRNMEWYPNSLWRWEDETE